MELLNAFLVLSFNSLLVLSPLIVLFTMLSYRFYKWYDAIKNKNPMLIWYYHDDAPTYYEYNHALNKYVKNETAHYDKNDPNLYSVDYR